MFPLGFVSLDGVGEVSEESEGVGSEVVSGKSYDVEPDLVRNEVEGSGSLGLSVERGASFQEHVDVAVGNLLGSDQDLEADHQDVGDLVFFEKSSVDIFVDVVG